MRTRTRRAIKLDLSELTELEFRLRLQMRLLGKLGELNVRANQKYLDLCTELMTELKAYSNGTNSTQDGLTVSAECFAHAGEVHAALNKVKFVADEIMHEIGRTVEKLVGSDDGVDQLDK